MGLLEKITRGSPPNQPIIDRGERLQRDVEPLEGTSMSLWNSIIPTWWAENGLTPSQWWVPGNGILAERVWIVNRCIQMNAQQIASMPLRFESPNVAVDTEPAWIGSPDPTYFPNGIGDAVHAIVHEMYAWGYAVCAVTSRYFNGYPRTWTVLPSSKVSIRFDEDGRRVTKLGDTTLDPEDVIQIDRNPGCGAHGTSALWSYAQMAWGLLAAGNTSMTVSQGGMPRVWLGSKRKIDAKQAEAMQTQWMQASMSRNGAPPVIDTNQVEPQELSFNPSDLALLQTQEWNALSLAAAFGVPGVLLNMAIRYGMTYQNPGMLGEMWWRFELRPTAKRISDAFSAQMLPSGQWVWFDAADTFEPFHQETGVVLGPFASDDDDTESSAVAKDTQAAPAVAAASPAQKPATLTAIGGNG